MKKNKNNISSQNPSTKEQIFIPKFSKEALIESLKNMNRNPEAIKISCAMCYVGFRLPDDIEYKCKRCGHINIFARNSLDGMFASHFPYLKRWTIPYNILFDPTGLCKKCRDKDKELSKLTMRVSCFNCEKEFSVGINNEEKLNKIRWLYLKPPIKELNFGPQDIIYSPNYIAEFIFVHVFCPDCQKIINIDFENK